MENSLMTKRQTSSPSLNEEIVAEALKWVKGNCGTECSKCGDYPSPRVSSEIPDCSFPMSFDQYNYCALGCVYCVQQGTEITIDFHGKTKPVESLQVGDYVVSKNLKTGKVGMDKITSVMERNVPALFEISGEDGRKIFITGEHPVHVKDRGWVTVDSLKTGDDIDNWVEIPPSTARLMESGRNKLLAYNARESTKQMNRKRLQKDNPMKDLVVSAQQGETIHRKYKTGERTPYWKGKKKPDAVERMLTNNPMKNPKTRRATLKKIVATWVRNGKSSKGEQLIRASLSRLGVNFVQQMIIPGPKGRDYVLDFMLPEVKCCVEYDGHSRHYTEKGKQEDQTRDCFLRRLRGIRTLRIHRDLAFIEEKALDQTIHKMLKEIK